MLLTSASTSAAMALGRTHCSASPWPSCPSSPRPHEATTLQSAAVEQQEREGAEHTGRRGVESGGVCWQEGQKQHEATPVVTVQIWNCCVARLKRVDATQTNIKRLGHCCNAKQVQQQQACRWAEDAAAAVLTPEHRP
jgi:hypothetical protein